MMNRKETERSEYLLDNFSPRTMAVLVVVMQRLEKLVYETEGLDVEGCKCGSIKFDGYKCPSCHKGGYCHDEP